MARSSVKMASISAAGDRAEEGEGGREAALRTVGEYLPGALPPGMAGLDFEHGLAGRHVGESQRQIHLGQPAELAGKVVADAVFFDGFRGRAAVSAGLEQIHGRSAAVAGEPGTDAGNRPAVRKLNGSSPVVRFTSPQSSHRSGSRPAAGIQAIAGCGHTED